MSQDGCNAYEPTKWENEKMWEKTNVYFCYGTLINITFASLVQTICGVPANKTKANYQSHLTYTTFMWFLYYPQIIIEINKQIMSKGKKKQKLKQKTTINYTFQNSLFWYLQTVFSCKSWREEKKTNKENTLCRQLIPWMTPSFPSSYSKHSVSTKQCGLFHVFISIYQSIIKTKQKQWKLSLQYCTCINYWWIITKKTKININKIRPDAACQLHIQF